jgi:hypothetical protein
MNTDPILSILTPTIPGREKQLAALQAEIEKQAGDLPVEHLCLCDNKKRSIGAKRQALVDIARGHYIAFVDDDDKVRPAYIHSLVAAMKSSPDVITFEQDSTYNKLKSKVVFKLGQGDGPYTPDGITQRDAWHVCAWKRSRVLDCLFGESNYGEDRDWCVQARQKARHSVHIPKVLQEYHHSTETTAAPEGAED